MTNIESLRKQCPKSLGDIRQRLGAEDEADTSCDELINHMNAEECAQKLSGWRLGDESWATLLISVYDAVQNKEKAK